MLRCQLLLLHSYKGPGRLGFVDPSVDPGGVGWAAWAWASGALWRWGAVGSRYSEQMHLAVFSLYVAWVGRSKGKAKKR